MWNKQHQAPSQWRGGPWPQKMRWAARGSSLGSHGWGVMVTQFPLPILCVMNHRLTSWEQWFPSLPRMLPTKGRFPGTQWLKASDSSEVPAPDCADSVSGCFEDTPPRQTCGRSLGLCLQSFIRPLFLLSLRGPDSALLENEGPSLELCPWNELTTPTTHFFGQLSQSKATRSDWSHSSQGTYRWSNPWHTLSTAAGKNRSTQRGCCCYGCHLFILCQCIAN